MLSIVFFFKGGYLIDLDISGEFVSSYHVFFGQIHHLVIVIIMLNWVDIIFFPIEITSTSELY